MNGTGDDDLWKEDYEENCLLLMKVFAVTLTKGNIFRILLQIIL
jgi:hypothetical protein